MTLCDELCALEELGLPFSRREKFVGEMTELLTAARSRYVPLARTDSLRDTFWHRRLLNAPTAAKDHRP